MAGCYQMATSEHFTLENVCCPSDRTFSMPMENELQLYYKRIFCCLSSGIRPERVKKPQGTHILDNLEILYRMVYENQKLKISLDL